MIQNFIISTESVLIAEMKALEAQFQLPLFNPEARALRQSTEVALGEVYRELMFLKAKAIPKAQWTTRTKSGKWLLMPGHLVFDTRKLADDYLESLK